MANNYLFEKLASMLDTDEREFLLSKLETLNPEVMSMMINNQQKRQSILQYLQAREKKIQKLYDNTDDSECSSETNKLPHILVVDDDPIALRTMMNLLHDEYRVSVAKSGAQALTFLGQEIPDLILLDYEMPIMDGVSTLKVIRSEEKLKNIPVIFLTSVKDADSVKKAIALKPNGYVLKTANPEEIKIRIMAELT